MIKVIFYFNNIKMIKMIIEDIQIFIKSLLFKIINLIYILITLGNYIVSI